MEFIQKEFYNYINELINTIENDIELRIKIARYKYYHNTINETDIVDKFILPLINTDSFISDTRQSSNIQFIRKKDEELNIDINFILGISIAEDTIDSTTTDIYPYRTMNIIFTEELQSKFNDAIFSALRVADYTRDKINSMFIENDEFMKTMIYSSDNDTEY